MGLLFCISVCLVVPACITPTSRINREVYLWAYLAVLAVLFGSMSAYETEMTALWLMMALPGVMVAAFRLVFFPGDRKRR
ncbi:hypothetical protein [Catellatospora paridis]|uniref:hypothetical protein n=1 Tax=Catellatospora paridis TaxID=1617086 RepID=UPI0012D3C35F|nr:hypothetical protein [Catellatospora paridis]